MSEFKPNPPLHERAPEKKVEKIISGPAKVKKKSGLIKLADIFMEDDVNNVKSYIFDDVVIPTIKRGLYDALEGSLSMLLLGRTGGNNSRSTADKVSYRNYTSYSNKRGGDSRPVSRSGRGYDYDEIVLNTRGEAEDVLARMDELVSTYGIVSVADFYDLCGITCQYTDNRYGWTNIRNAQVIRVRDGYMIKMPKAMPLD